MWTGKRVDVVHLIVRVDVPVDTPDRNGIPTPQNPGAFMSQHRSSLTRARVAALLWGAMASWTATVEAGDKVLRPVAALEQGRVVGSRLDGIDRYLGIPYARPPTGALRWQPPQAPAAWQGAREATRFGSACAQTANYFTTNDPAAFDRPYGSEDCLYLNVWSPSGSAPAPRPVVVFIHGGSAVVGAASLPLYDGERLARELGAVFVSLNYRLGFLGIVNLPMLRSGDRLADSGSFALLDQIRALEWVQRNAASFGGHPQRVTVMGHSAGCSSIWNLMNSPLASGKFQKAVCLSGMPQQSTDTELAEPGRQLLSRLLIKDRRIATSEGLDDYLARQPANAVRGYLYGKSAVEVTTAARGIAVVRERVDGHVITSGPEGPLVNPVPAILGTTRDEMPFLLLRKFSPHTVSDMWRLIQSREPLTQRDFFSGYLDLIQFKLVSWVVNARALARVGAAADLLAATQVPVYRYEFEWAQVPQPWKSLWGAYHGIDIPFLFGNFGLDHPDFTDFTWGASKPEDRERIHRQMVTALRGFIESSDPNRHDPALNWPRWSGGGTALQIR